MDFKKLSQRLVVYGITTNHPQIDIFLEKQNIKPLKIDRIPSIIDTQKNYSSFKLLNKETYSEKVILISNDKKNNLIEVQLILLYDYFNYKEVLNHFLPSQITTPSAYQIIGTILHVNLDEEHFPYKKIIGEILLSKNSKIKTVVTKTSEINTLFRECQLEIIAGEDNFCTYHTESNCRFFIDYKNVYWNSKLETERNFLIRKFKKDEILLDPFCGVGPLTIRAAKLGLKVFCNDLNPIAINCLKENVKINHLNPISIQISNLDAKDFILQNKNVNFNHIFLNLPGKSLEHLKYLKSFKNAIVYCYFFGNKNESPELEIEKYCKLERNKVFIEERRNVAPNKCMYLLMGMVRFLNILD